jgi:hypothetical protein
MKTATLAGPIEAARPMNPASAIFPDMAPALQTTRDLCAFFGYTQHQLSQAADRKARIIVLARARREARWAIVMACLAEIRAIRSFFQSFDVPDDLREHLNAALIEINKELVHSFRVLDGK